MPNIIELTAWRDALLQARYAGVRQLEYDGKRVMYGSDAEMAAAIADLEHRITGQTGRVTQVQINSSKGV